MGKIKKLIENELVGGTQTTDVYPVTSVKAVYDENNERLDNILNRRGVVNISTNYNNDHIAEVLTLSQAIAKVPSSARVLGFSGTYLDSDGWHTIIYTGDSLTTWSTTSNWINFPNKIYKSLLKNATFAGIATLTTNPGVPDSPVFYLTATAGTYPNFNGIEVQDGEAVIFLWTNNMWSKKVTGFATQEKLSQLAKNNTIYNITKLVPISGVYDFSSAKAAAANIIKGEARLGAIIEFATEKDTTYNKCTKYESYRYISQSVSDGAFGSEGNWEKSDLYKNTLFTRKTIDLRKLAPLESGFYTLATAIEAVINNKFAVGTDRNGCIITFTTSKDVYNNETVETWMFANYTSNSDGAFRSQLYWTDLTIRVKKSDIKVYSLDDIIPLQNGYYNISTAITASLAFVPANNRYGTILEFKVDDGTAYHGLQVWIYRGNSESDGAYQGLLSWEMLYSTGKPQYCLNNEIDSFIKELYIPYNANNEVIMNTLPFIRSISKNVDGNWAVNIKNSDNILLFRAISESPERGGIIKLEPYGNVNNNFSEAYMIVDWSKMEDNHNYLQNDAVLTRNAYDASKSPTIHAMLENRKNNPLFNKYIACLGDSYTGGVNNNWVSFIGSRTGAKMVNYGSFGSTVLPMDCQLMIETQDYTKASDMVAVGDTFTCTDLYSNGPVNFSIKAASTTDLKITINITSGVMRNMYDNAGKVTATKTSGASGSVGSFVLGTPVQIEYFASRARRIDANYADIIAVFGGVNDALMVHVGRETIGTLEGMEEGSFYKNYRDLLVQIIRQFPTKKVVTIAPPHIQSGATNYAGNIASISKAVKDISQLLAIPCADLFNECCGFSNITEQNAVVYPNTSNVHPNTVGQKLMSIGIENGLKKSVVSEFFI